MSKRHKEQEQIKHIEQELRKDERKIEHLEHEVHELEHDKKRKPTKIHMRFTGKGIDMDGTILKGQTQIDAVATESNAAGPVAIVPANLSWSVDDPTIVSPAINPDGSATFTKVGSSAVDRVATVTVTDTFFSLTKSYSLTVQGDGLTNPPTAIDFTFSNGR